jgi:hypothetical protein
VSASRSFDWAITLLAVSCLPTWLAAQQDTSATVSAPQSVRSASPGGAPSSMELGDDTYAWNAALDVTSIHTSNTGWATLASPSAGYRFNSIFSADATLPIYFYRLAESRSAKPKPNATLVNQRGEVGDLILSGHAQFLPRLFDYELTGAVTAPTGDKPYGLTTGRVTFDISNQLERNFGRLTPTLEIGGGDSSTLVNRLVTKTYTSLGPLAHFQTGLAAQLTSRISLEGDAFEQLPIGDQKIYTSKTTKNKTTTVVTGRNVSEDNGFNAVFEATLDRHTVFTSYYSRSLRLHLDTVSVGLAYFLRSSTPEPDLTLEDLIR